jgi:hypothetical protein
LRFPFFTGMSSSEAEPGNRRCAGVSCC